MSKVAIIKYCDCGTGLSVLRYVPSAVNCRTSQSIQISLFSRVFRSSSNRQSFEMSRSDYPVFAQASCESFGFVPFLCPILIITLLGVTPSSEQCSYECINSLACKRISCSV